MTKTLTEQARVTWPTVNPPHAGRGSFPEPQQRFRGVLAEAVAAQLRLQNDFAWWLMGLIAAHRALLAAGYRTIAEALEDKAHAEAIALEWIQGASVFALNPKKFGDWRQLNFVPAPERNNWPLQQVIERERKLLHQGTWLLKHAIALCDRLPKEERRTLKPVLTRAFATLERDKASENRRQQLAVRYRPSA